MKDKIKNISQLRQKLKEGKTSIGSWMQIPHASIAEIMGDSGFEWVAVDLEHGAIGVQQLPDLFRAIELGGTLPLARLAEGKSKDCKHALDAGAAGVIIPMIENAEHLASVVSYCCWPSTGKRGVGFSRANLFGKYFDDYKTEAQSPLIIAMIENVSAVKDLDSILKVKGLDAILIGPYDLSASLKKTAQFDDPEFKHLMSQILLSAQKAKIPCGIHVVEPSREQLESRILEGYQFLAYSIDAVMLRQAVHFQTT